MLKSKFLLTLTVLFLLKPIFAEDAPFIIAEFSKEDDLRRVDFSKENVELSVGPRSVTDTKNVLKYVALKGEWPSFGFYPPKIPKDWTKYEALSFSVWTNNDCELGLRIDDEKSFNYNTRFNYSVRIQKGRTTVQIPTKNIAKTLDISKIKMMGVNTDHPPSGFTLFFSDFKLGKMEAQKVDFIPYAERYDLDPAKGLEVVTPHFPMGRNLAGGPLNVFMLSSVKFGREVTEMMQRTDLNVSLLSWDREWGANTWGFGDFYGQRGHSIDCTLMQKYLDSSMQGPEKFSAMAMFTPLGWSKFTPGARAAILKRVKENGEGLVFVMPYTGEKDQSWPDDLKEVCALINSDSDFPNGDYVRYAVKGRIWGKPWKKTKEHPITNGVPIEALPFAQMETQKFDVAPGAEVLIALDSGEPVLAVRQVGKGRVVTIAARSLSLTPTMGLPHDFANAPRYRYWEPWYNLIDRAVLWAGGREFSRKGTPSELKVSAENADSFFTVQQWKDDSGKVTDWELLFKDPAPALKKFALKVPDVVKHGETITATFTAPEIDAVWTATLGELGGDTWRTLETLPVNRKDGKVEIPTARVRQNMCLIKIEAKANGTLLAEGRGEVAITPEPVWNDYQVFTWLEDGLPFMQEFEMKRMRELGVTGNTASATDMESIRKLFRGGLLAHPVGFTQGLHAHDFDAHTKSFRETKDKKFLIRNPSYADDAFVAKEKASVQKMAADLSKYSPLSMIMSDETALTSYTAEFDFDFHPGNIAKFREKLKSKFGTVDALNAALHCGATSFEELMPPTSDEAKAAKNFGLWNEWRAHNDDMWAGAFQMYGDAMKEKYPASRLSVSGTQEQAVFNGIDWAKMTPNFGAVCGYGGRFQELQRLSYQTSDVKATPWGAYGRSGRAVDHQVWASLLTGGDGMALFWWISLRNADLTFCKSGKDYQRACGEMERGIGKQYMNSQRVFSPVAILWSANSQRASWSQGKFNEFKKVEDEVVNAVIDAEFDPYFISEQQIAAGELAKRGTRVVVLPMSLSLGKGEKSYGLGVVPALEKLLAAGGAVVVTDTPQMDEFLQPVAFPESFTSKLAKFSEVKSNLAEAFAKGGAKPAVPMTVAGGKLKKTNAIIHAISGQAEGKLLTILRAPVGQKEVIGADGVIRAEPDTEGGKEVESLELDVSSFGNANFYDIRKQALMKPDGGKLKIEMPHGAGYPIAVLPYTVDGITATATVADKALNVEVKLTSGAKALTTHIVRVEVLDANTSAPIPYFCKNISCDATGKAALSLPLSDEDLGRSFKVQARDILSGQQATVDVKR